jgi:hypothetical protein
METLARRAWQAWGHAWSMYTACSGCKQVKVCKGKRRDGMLCLECFDEKAPA